MLATNAKIAIIGAGFGQFLGGTARDLRMSPGLRGSHVASIDLDPHRLDLIFRPVGRQSGNSLPT